MKLPKPSDGGGPRENAPAGSYIGTCIRFIDLGTQQREYMGEKKVAHEVVIMWELTDELMSDGKPFAVSKFYNWSMHEKSNLRKDLESWRGKAFEPSDFDGATAFDTKNLLGKPAMISIVEYTKKTGEKSTRADSVTKPLKGFKPPEPVNPLVYLSLDPDEFKQDVYDGLTNGIKEIIANSPEFKELSRKSGPAEHVRAASDNYAGHDPDDDIPF